MHIFVILLALPVVALADFQNAAMTLFSAVDGGPVGDGTVYRSESQPFLSLLDTDFNGEVDYNEFKAALDVSGKVAYRGSEEQLFDAVDSDGDGLLNAQDFEADFVVFDTNRDGGVTEDEFEAAIAAMSA